MVGTGAAVARRCRSPNARGVRSATLLPRSSCRRSFFATPPTTASSRFFDALFSANRAAAQERLALQLPEDERHHVPRGSRRSSHGEFPGRNRRNEGQLERRALQRELLARHPELAIFPATEETLLDAKAYGARRLHLRKRRALAGACASSVCKRRRCRRCAGARRAHGAQRKTANSTSARTCRQSARRRCMAPRNAPELERPCPRCDPPIERDGNGDERDDGQHVCNCGEVIANNRKGVRGVGDMQLTTLRCHDNAGIKNAPQTFADDQAAGDQYAEAPRGIGVGAERNPAIVERAEDCANNRRRRRLGWQDRRPDQPQAVESDSGP